LVRLLLLLAVNAALILGYGWAARDAVRRRRTTDYRARG
jgi:hypothetical protein